MSHVTRQYVDHPSPEKVVHRRQTLSCTQVSGEPAGGGCGRVAQWDLGLCSVDLNAVLFSHHSFSSITVG